MDTAVQFLCTVAGSFQDVDKRPKSNPSVTEVHTYTLHTLIRDSAKIGRDAGIMHFVNSEIISDYCVVFRLPTGAVFGRCNSTSDSTALQPNRASCPVQDASSSLFLCRNVPLSAPHYVDQLFTQIRWPQPHYPPYCQNPFR